MSNRGRTTRAAKGSDSKGADKGGGKGKAKPVREPHGHPTLKLSRTAFANDFRLMLTDRASVVATEDNLLLNVREVGPPDAPVTLVFAHGFCLEMRAWHYQRVDLERIFGDQVRMVFYDQRGHGLSGTPSDESCTIRQLGRDFAAVVAARAPHGPVIPVGHSMGGMTVLAFASQYPELVQERVIGTGLVATAAFGLTDAGFAKLLDTPAIKAARLAVRAAPTLIQQSRDAIRPLMSPIMKVTSYGDFRIDASVARFSEQMTNDTSLKTLVNFLGALEKHDERDALPVLAPLPAVVVCGDGDMVTPFRNSVALAEGLPHAELLRIPKSGHMVEMEQPTVVSEALERLVRRSLQHAQDEKPHLVKSHSERSFTGVFRGIGDRAGHRGVWPPFGGRAGGG